MRTTKNTKTAPAYDNSKVVRKLARIRKRIQNKRFEAQSLWMISEFRQQMGLTLISA